MAARFSVSVILQAIDKLSGPLSDGQKALRSVGATANSVGRSLTMAVSVPLAGWATLVAITGSSLEKSLAKIRDTTGSTKDQVAPLRAVALATESLGFSATDAAAAMVLLADQGLAVTDMAKGLTPAITLARASDADLVETTRTLVTLAAGYGVELTNLGHLTDVLTVASRHTVGGFQAVAEGLQYVAPLAEEMGIKLEDAAAAVAITSRALKDGSQAGMALNTAIAQLANASSTARKALAGMHIPKAELIDGKGNVIGYGNTLRVLAAHGVTAEKALQIFGKRAGRGMAALLGAGLPAYERMQKLLEDGVGASAERAGILMDTADGSLKRFWADLRNLGAVVADSGVLEGMSTLVKNASGLVRWFAALPAPVRAVGIALAVFVGLAGPAILVATQLTATLATLQVAWTICGAALLANPLTWIPLAVAGVIVLWIAVIAFLYSMKGHWGAVWDWMKDHTLLVFIGLSAAGQPLLAMAFLIARYWGEAGDWIVEKWTKVKSLFVDLGDLLKDMWALVSGKAPDWVYDGLHAVLEQVIGGPQGANLQTANSSSPRDPQLAPQKALVQVDFNGVPKGTRVETAPGSGQVDLNVGYMSTAHY